MPAELVTVTVAGRRRGRGEAPRGGAVRRIGRCRGVAADRDGGTDELQCRGRLRGLLHRDQRLHVGVHVDLLLDRGEFDQLLSELTGIERGERILVLQLRGQQLEKGIEIAGESAAMRHCLAAWAAEAPEELDPVEPVDDVVPSVEAAEFAVESAVERVLMVALVLRQTIAGQTLISTPLPSPARV